MKSEQEKYNPELGQALYGQPFNEYSVPGFLEKALEAINQVMFDLKMFTPAYLTPFGNSGARFKNDVFECNAYDWSDCYCEGDCTCGHVPQLYNFKYKDIEVSWYKYLGRGMSVNRQVTAIEVSNMLTDCLSSLLNKDQKVQECDATEEDSSKIA